MRTFYQLAASTLLASALLTATGCAEHRYRTYDPYYNDHHRWNADEDRYYHTWYVRTYPNREYRDYSRLEKKEQERYWHERHEHHGDHDHDHDHDRDRH